MTEPKRILYRGVPMIEGWPEIQEPQRIMSYTHHRPHSKRKRVRVTRKLLRLAQTCDQIQVGEVVLKGSGDGFAVG